ncbi:MAG: hypothetical protein A2992_00175 [Elusimicrobia bacterium RIFCSPLOWO2_01_FULL_59_12]|nr:MAG: hypothetical protein A2992_00175 [Elusimicrobia bacterium RIFCSPLOWO2_01_FULL_59_12]
MVNESAIQQIASQIAHQFHPQAIFLFGSYAYGKPTPDSDVDLLVAMDTSLRNVDQAVKIRRAIDFPFPVDLLVRTPMEIQKRLAMGDAFIQEVTQRGKVLYEAGH